MQECDFFTFNFTNNEEINRRFNSSFPYLLFIFSIIICIWLLFCNKIALSFGLFGCVINIFMDYFIWYKWLKIRTIKGIDKPFFFFLMFMTYGITQFSYAIILFQGNALNIIIFSILDFVGLTIIGEISKKFGKPIEISRFISDKHWIYRIIFVILGYAIIYWIYFDFILIGKLILIGIIVELSLELPLLINQTRNFHYRQFILNLLFEFNLGIPILFLLYQYFIF